MRLVIPDLLPGTEYAIQVRADEGSVQSQWSPVFSVTTIENDVLPEAPTNVTWVVSGDSFYAEWDSVNADTDSRFTMVTRYELELVGNGITQIVSVPQQTGSRVNYTLNFETNRSLFNNPAATVTLRIRAVDQTDLKSAWTPVESETNPEPAPVTDLVATGLIDSIGLSWIAPSDTDVVGYNIYASTVSGFTPTSGNKVGFSAGTSFNYNTIIYSAWHFVVRSVDKFGSEGIIVRASATPQSSFTVDTTPPNPPTSVIATTGFDTTKQQSWANIAWTASTSTDVKRYEVRYSTSAGTNWNYLSVPGDATSVRIENLVPATAYYIDVRATDFSGNVSAWVNDPATGPTKYPITTAADTTAPSTPAAPSAAANTMQIQVSHNGLKAAGGAIESDVVYYEVFAGTSAAPTNMIGTIQASTLDRSGVETFNVPASGGVSQGWIVRVKAVDRAGLKSAYSADSSTVGVPLISATNITNATITNAQISNVNANQIQAGTGFINDLTVKSKFTLGDASTDGVIESYDYGTSAGTTGFRLAKSGLIIKTGQIEAAALKIQSGNNLMPARYADFEAASSSYVFLTSGGAQTVSVINTSSRFNNQSMRATWGAVGAAPVAFMTPASGSYNINVEAGGSYIVSAYLWNTGAVSTSVSIGIVWGNASNGLISSSIANTQTISASTASTAAVRMSGVVVAPAGAVKASVFVQGNTLTSGAGYNIDGWQVERQIGALTTPSQWNPPGQTLIDGGLIRTGEISSTAGALMADGTTSSTEPAWSINTTGNAVLGNVRVRGSLLVGSGPTDNNSIVKSANFDPSVQTTGWIIRSDGSARFNNVDADSLSGLAIRTGTLTVDKLSSGNMTAGIELSGEGGIFSTGSLGQSVRMSSSGFSVTAPPTTNITNIIIASGLVTLTTDIANAVAVGDTIRVIDLPAYVPPDETFIVTNVSGTTVEFNAPGLASVSSTAVAGRLQGGALVTGKTQDLLVDFPSDGLRPNIVSGLLTGDTILSKDNLIIFDSASIEPGANLTLSSGITTPKAKATIREYLPKEEVAGFATAPTDVSDFYLPAASGVDTATGYVYTLGMGATEDATNYKLEITVQRWNESTRVVTEVMPKTLIVDGVKASPSYLYGAKVRGFTLSDGYWWTLLKKSFFNPNTNAFWETISLLRLNATTWATTEYPVIQTASGWHRDWALGKDHTTANSLVFLCGASVVTSVKDPEFHGGNVNIASGNDIAFRITTTSGAPTMSGGFVSMTTLGTLNNVDSSEKTAVEMGQFDFGAGNNRIIVKGKDDNYYTSFGFLAYPTTGGSYDSTRTWESDFYSTIDANFFWNSSKGKFYEGNWTFLSSDFIKQELFEYQGGDAFWTTGSEGGAKFYIGYSWYDSVAPIQETQIGGITSIYMRKRHTISVTIPDIPYQGTSDYPDRAKVWAVKANTQPVITSTTWKRRAQIFYPGTNAVIDIHNAPSADVPKAANDFTAVGTGILPSQIISATGNSYWKGDDTAQFYQLVLTSATDASTAAGNKPPLRIGNTAGTHLRIDGNEIIAMTSNSAQGALILNSGGQVSVSDITMGTIIGGVTGTGTLVMGSIRGTASVIDLSLDGGGTTGASVNNAGRFVRTTSSARYKDNITPMSLEMAKTALELEPVTFNLKDELEMDERPMYPGFIAEQADEVGAHLWVFKDSEGRPDGFRYAELTAAHNMLIKELYQKNEELQEQIDALRA